MKGGGGGDPGEGLAPRSRGLRWLFQRVPPPPGQGKGSDCPWRAGSQHWGSAGSTGEGVEWLEELCRGSAPREPRSAIHPVQKSAGCHASGSKTLPDSCSNSSLLSLGQEGALPASPSSPSQREEAEGAFLVKFPPSSLPLGPAGSALSACPTRAPSPQSGGNHKRMGGFYASRHLPPLPAQPRKSAGCKRLHR